MSIYKNLDSYFDQCANCGSCCTVPGMFLPGQIDPLAEHLKLTRRELFDGYLIAELCAPRDCYRNLDDCVTPVISLSPVKVDRDGKRFPQKLFDKAYVNKSQYYCIFRDRVNNRCSIHGLKPFECAVMLCPVMTRDNPLYLGKAYYYSQWKDARELAFSLYPELKPIYQRLDKSLEWFRKSFEQRNRTIDEIRAFMNGEAGREGSHERL